MKNKKGFWLRRFLGKASLFSFFRMVAYTLGMATPAGVLLLLGAIIVGTIIGLGIYDAVQMIHDAKAVVPVA